MLSLGCDPAVQEAKEVKGRPDGAPLGELKQQRHREGHPGGCRNKSIPTLRFLIL